MEKRWILKDAPDSKAVADLSSQININVCLASILVQRGIFTFQQAKSFFRPSLQELHDPFLMKGMDKAVLRIKQAIDNEEKILIYGDYDVDGTTAVSLVYNYFHQRYSRCDIYIPDRYAEGYGVSQIGVEWAADNGFSLVVALDCGIKAEEMVRYAKGLHVEFIICDHHLPGEEVPDACSVLDPKQSDCPYPYKELSGCGLGFKLIQGYAQRYENESEIFQYLDLVAVSIASDIVPITGENRILAFHGLKKLHDNPIPGLEALKEISGIKDPLDISGVVFTLGPRINAAGRIGHGSAAVELLTADSKEKAYATAEAINVNNHVRKQFDSDITEEALAMIEETPIYRSAKSTVLYKNDWHKGVIGIVASRCIEKYYRPTIILTESNNKVTGSARSVFGFNLYDAIYKCRDLLDKFGGHMYAAGLTLDEDKVEAFRERFEQVVATTITSEMLIPAIPIDGVIEFDRINQKFINILKQMAPFGPENPRPVFKAEKVYVFNSLTSIKEKHVRFLAKQQGNENVFQVIGFDQAEHYNRLSQGGEFSMAFTVEENNYNGNTSIQLRIKDIKF